MGVARRTAKELETICLIAYKMHHPDDPGVAPMSFAEIADELSGPPYLCGGKSTAERWVNMGRRLIDDDTDGMNDQLRKRRIQRRVADDVIWSQFDKVEKDIECGLEGRAPLRNVQARLLEMHIHLHGLRRAPKSASVKVTGDGGRARVDPALLGALAGIPREELDALIDELHGSPDGRNPE